MESRGVCGDCVIIWGHLFLGAALMFYISVEITVEQKDIFMISIEFNVAVKVKLKVLRGGHILSTALQIGFLDLFVVLNPLSGADLNHKVGFVVKIPVERGYPAKRIPVIFCMVPFLFSA